MEVLVSFRIGDTEINTEIKAVTHQGELLRIRTIHRAVLKVMHDLGIDLRYLIDRVYHNPEVRIIPLENENIEN